MWHLAWVYRVRNVEFISLSFIYFTCVCVFIFIRHKAVFISIKMMCLPMFNEEPTRFSLALHIFPSIFSRNCDNIFLHCRSIFDIRTLIVDA